MPVVLGKWLDVANQVPETAVNWSMLPFGVQEGPLGFKDFTQLRGASEDREWVLRFSKHLEQKGWGPEALGVLAESTSSDEIVAGVFKLSDLRRCIEMISKADRNTDKQWLPMPQEPAARLRIEQGRILLRPSKFVGALEGVEVERIRKCPVCDHFFWAGRLDKSACAEACARVLRQRRLRENRKYKNKQKKVK